MQAHEFGVLHRSRIENVRDLALRGSIVIQGGRGTGKTTLLQSLGDHFGVPLIDGRAGELSMRQLMNHDIGPKVFIDNLDALLTAGPKTDLISLTGVLRRLTELQPTSNDINSGRLLIATSNILFGGGLDIRLRERILDANTQRLYLDAYSPVLTKCSMYKLEWWSRGWRERWIADFGDSFRKRLSSQTSDAWCQEILSLSGGHPCVFGIALERLFGLCDKLKHRQDSPRKEMDLMDTIERRLVAPDDAGERQLLNTHIRHDLEDVIERGAVRPLRAAILALRDSPDPPQRESFSELHSIALKNGTVAVPAPSPKIRTILEDQALIYRDRASGQYIIPGQVLVAEILAAGDTPFESVSLIADDGREHRGEVIVRSGTGTHSLRVSGAPWQVLSVLYQKKDEYISVGQLQEQTALADDRAVQNAIQRLRRLLEDLKAAHFIESEYRRGYRLVTRITRG